MAVSLTEQRICISVSSELAICLSLIVLDTFVLTEMASTIDASDRTVKIEQRLLLYLKSNSLNCIVMWAQAEGRLMI